MKKYAWIGLCIILLVLPLFGGCKEAPVATEKKTEAVAPEKLVCLDCHRQRNVNTNEGVLSSNAFCRDCHVKPETVRKVNDAAVSLVIPETMFTGNPHKFAACIHCHTDVARSPHRSEAGTQCLSCHEPHGESQAHDPHVRVRCEACHFSSKPVRLDADTDRVVLSGFNAAGMPVSLAGHEMADPEDPAMCEKCHFSGNPVGAPNAALPAKSLLCVMCHATPLSVGNWMFWVALAVLLVGLFGLVSFWFKGALHHNPADIHRKVSAAAETAYDAVFTRKIFSLKKRFLLDVVLQRRILQESVRRWTIHSLIYLAFLGRFCLSVFAMAAHGLASNSAIAMALMDKNHWFTAAVYDAFGLFILLGVALAAIMRFYVKPRHVLSEEQDNAALIIVGGIVLTGFILEGARILGTQATGDGVCFAFVGQVFAAVMSVLPASWQGAYGGLWYLHALSWLAFIIYLPFGKLKHVITTPLNLMLGGQEEHS